MLMNLRGIYTGRGDTARLLVILDRLIDLLPDLTSELLERAALYERLGAPAAALADFRRYLEVDPDGEGARSARSAVERLSKRVEPSGAN
jgi:regulator of sirC expression with transglutaminase-like and TPR domain